MKEEIITEYNNLYQELSKLKEIITYDFLSIDRIQIAYLDSYIAKKECVNVEKFEFVFNALIDRKISNNMTVGAIKNLGFIFDYNSIIYFIPESV